VMVGTLRFAHRTVLRKTHWRVSLHLLVRVNAP